MKNNLKFIQRLTEELDLLERLINNETLEDYGRIGAEQEFCIVDNNFRANPINKKILKKISKDGFVTEIAKFNMELNTEPIDISKHCLKKLESELVKKMEINNEKGNIDYSIGEINMTQLIMDMEHRFDPSRPGTESKK